MPVRMRLQRWGMVNKPFYRIVSADSHSKRDGKFLEILGTYNPLPDKQGRKELRLREDKVKYWLAVGAQPTETVARLLGEYGLCPMPPRSFKPTYLMSRKEINENDDKLDYVLICKRLGLM